MSDIVTELAGLLGEARRPGDFYASGTIALLPPSLSVQGVGAIALPLLPVQAEQLIAVAQQAPYGRGADTIIDTDVRNSWQIEPERVRIGGRHWPKTLASILEQVTEGLGVSAPVEAEFYKMLIYDKGSFFVGHRDTEKTPGMFATLVIVLPSSSSGGELVVRHKDRSVSLDLRVDDPAEVAFAAFYADCLHEVRPVTAGCRLTLVYNLVRHGKGDTPLPPNYITEQDQVAALLRDWRDAMDTDNEPTEPEKLVYPLAHAYTAASLDFSMLKGEDAAAAGVLTAATLQADCALHLALLTLEEFGTAEYAENYGRRRRWSRGDDDDDDQFEVGEIDDWTIALSDWCAPDGSPIGWGEIPVTKDELSPPDPFEGLEPDELHFEEASGNAGVSFERRYRRAALVIWPNDRAFAVLTQAGLGVTVPHLLDLAQHWEAAGTEPASPIWQQAHDLAGHMIEAWPQNYPGYGAPSTESNTSGLLGALTRLGDRARIAQFLTQVVSAGTGYAKPDNPAMIAALVLLPVDQAGVLIQQIVTGNAAKRFAACADLLRRIVAEPALLPLAEIRDAASMLIALMPSSGATQGWSPNNDKVEASFVADLLIGLGAIDPALADRAVTRILDATTVYGFDSILVPAVRDGLRAVDLPSVTRLRAACLAHLRARIALPLAPPEDWQRPSLVGCRCPRCSELSQFLADGTRKTWTLRAAEPERSHVEGTIRNAKCDLDMTTEQRGRPYSLVCTKNQASYERRARQRAQDVADEASLAELH